MVCKLTYLQSQWSTLLNKSKKYDEGSFGEQLALLIEKAGFKKNAFFKALGVSKSYLFDMLNNRTLPSNDMQLKIAETLELSDVDRRKFYDFTAAQKGELPADIVTSLKNNPAKYGEIRQLLQNKTHSNNSINRG